MRRHKNVIHIAGNSEIIVLTFIHIKSYLNLSYELFIKNGFYTFKHINLPLKNPFPFLKIYSDENKLKPFLHRINTIETNRRNFATIHK